MAPPGHQFGQYTQKGLTTRKRPAAAEAKPDEPQPETSDPPVKILRQKSKPIAKTETAVKTEPADVKRPSALKKKAIETTTEVKRPSALKKKEAMKTTTDVKRPSALKKKTIKTESAVKLEPTETPGPAAASKTSSSSSAHKQQKSPTRPPKQQHTCIPERSNLGFSCFCWP